MVYFVGAGPGDPELITEKGKRLLKEAELVIYAGSLVNPDLLLLCENHPTILDSSQMTLEQVLEVIVGRETEASLNSPVIVRLHTGEPSIYGAIREQMDALREKGIPYEVVPGISSFQAAAAALGVEYTLPGVSQSLIITRVEGRTAVPSGQQLRDLAAHHSSLALFLSSAYGEKVREELLEAGLSPETPVAICYKVSWPQEKIFTCTIDTLPGCLSEEKIYKTALILVGDFISASPTYEKSKLYDKTFTTACRKGTGKVAYVYVPGVEGDEQKAEGVSITDKLPQIKEFLREEGFEIRMKEKAGEAAREGFQAGDLVIFVSAMGICVRSIAPYLSHKTIDPAVLCVDASGNFVVPVVSGHLGGANELAFSLAEVLGASPVLTTASDVKHLPAADSLARGWNCNVLPKEGILRVAREILSGREAVLAAGDASVRLVPKKYMLGIGCKKDLPEEALEQLFSEITEANGISPGAFYGVCTIDKKAKEPAIHAFCKKHGLKLFIFSVEELKALKGEFSGSEFVEETVGVDNVCERSAIKGAGDAARLVVSKTKGEGCTMAIAAVGAGQEVAGNVKQGQQIAESADNVQQIAENADDRQNTPVSRGTLTILGMGPGDPGSLTIDAMDAILAAEEIYGYTRYVDLMQPLFPQANARWMKNGMRREADRCKMAIAAASLGKNVVLLSSGDAGIYGMAGLVMELLEGECKEKKNAFSVKVLPGLTAASSGAALLGAPLMNDFTVISLSDLMTPRHEILNHVEAAAKGDLVTVLYNPMSHRRKDLFPQVCKMFMEYREGETPCGWVEYIGRPGQKVHFCTLKELEHTELHMQCTVFIGNSRTVYKNGRLYTCRGYEVSKEKESV